MRRNLLSLFVLLLVAIGANAQTWTKPVAQGSDPVSGKVYQVMNVESGWFLAGGSAWYSWTTSTVLVNPQVSTPLSFTLNETATGWTLARTSDSKFTFISGAYEGKGEMHVDMGSQGHNFFEFIKQDNGFYHIRAVESDDAYGSVMEGWEEKCWGWEGFDSEFPTAVYATIVPGENAFCDWAFIGEVDLALFNARLKLYNLAQSIAEDGLEEYGATYEEYTDVFNSSDLDAINAALDELGPKVTEAKKAKAWATGTEENPSDVTFLLVNPSIDGNADGWTVDVPGAQNKGYQGAKYVNDVEGDLNNGVTITGFIEAWHPNTGLGNGKISQVVELPLGKYTLGVDVIATNQINTDQETSRETVEGFQLFALGGGIDNGVEVRSRNGKPEHYDFEFITAGGTTELGLRMVNATGNWFGADNFTLKYRGNDIDPFYFALPALIETCENEIFIDEVIANADIKQAYAEALEKAQEEISTTDGDYEGAYNLLTSTYNALKSSISDYQRLAALMERIQEDMEVYGMVENFGEEISKLYDSYSEAYEDQVATSEQIESWVSDYDAFILDGVKNAFPYATEETPLRISVLATNLNHDNDSKEGWTVTTGTAGNKGEYKVNYTTAEVWSNTFSCLQTLADMPAGKYVIKAKAFYRTSSNGAGYDDYIAGTGEILTYLVAGSNKAPVVNHAAGAIISETAPYTGYAETVEGSGIWVPNSQQSAEWAFAQDDTYACEVSTYLLEDGDLVFGLRNDELEDGNAWSIWDSFDIYYCGKSSNALYEQLLLLHDQAIELQPKSDMVEAASEKLNDAIQAAEDATGSDSEETLQGIINQIIEAMEYVNKSDELVQNIMSTVTIYSEKKDNAGISSSDESFEALMKEISAAVVSEYFSSNEQIEAWMDALPAAWISYVMGQDMTGASEETPIDITAILFNPDFESGNANYWTVDALGQNNGFQNNNTYSNTLEDGTEIVLSNFIETWRPSGADVTLDNGAISQTLGGVLPEGYYVLGADAHAVNQYATPEGGVQGVNLGVTVGDKSYTTNIGLDSAKPERFSVAFYSDGVSPITVGIFVEDCNANWLAADNFTLGYIGTVAPDAVEGITIADDADQSVAIYNLAGQRVSKATKGLYIINGKKVLVK